MQPTNSLELFFLSLVVLHAMQHFPHDASKARRQVRTRLEKLFPPHAKNRVGDVILEAVVVLSTLTAASPVFYYAYEWLTHWGHAALS